MSALASLFRLDSLVEEHVGVEPQVDGHGGEDVRVAVEGGRLHQHVVAPLDREPAVGEVWNERNGVSGPRKRTLGDQVTRRNFETTVWDPTRLGQS